VSAALKILVSVLTILSVTIGIILGARQLIPDPEPSPSGLGESGRAEKSRTLTAGAPEFKAAVQSAAPAADCDDEKLRNVLQLASSAAEEVVVNCNLRVPRNFVITKRQRPPITKRLIVKGSEGSGVTIDCNGVTIDGSWVPELSEKNTRKDMVLIKSTGVGEVWSRPTDVTVKNCKVNGAVRIEGVRYDDESKDIQHIRESSYKPGHATRMRNIAPTRITFDNLTITGRGRSPVFFGAGVTYSKLVNSELRGKAESVALYLEAESSRNLIKNNDIHTLTDAGEKPREVLAVDASDYNKIIDNRFSALRFGGIYLYRNCGQEGIVRHTTPSHNTIVNNVFYYKKYDPNPYSVEPSVYMGSRNGHKPYCDDEDEQTIGSGASDLDYARNNVVMQNQIYKLAVSLMIKEGRSTDSPNHIAYNTTVATPTARLAGCYVPHGYFKDFIVHGESIQVYRGANGVPFIGRRNACIDGELVCADCFARAGGLFGSVGLLPMDVGAGGRNAARPDQVTAQAQVGIASVITELPLFMEQNEVVTFETIELSSGSDPVLNVRPASLFIFGGSAVDDNGAAGPGTAARLVFRAPERGLYRLVVRARTQNTAGTATLLMNGFVYRRNVRFGGWQIRLSDLQAKEQLETTRLPYGAGGPQIMYVLGPDGLTINGRAYGEGRGGGAKLSLGNTLGSRWIVVGVPQTVAAGRARLVRNDVALPGRDPDGDGLGSELEKAIGTCSTQSLDEVVYGFSCFQIRDARDTDGDGIGDGWEFLGRDYIIAPGAHQSVPIPLWGANPRHKDLFAEIDFQRRCPGDGEIRMTAENAREFAAIYEDRMAPLSADGRLRHARSLQNPDFLPGIETHLDIGRRPKPFVDATTYGDWGGYTAVPPTGTSTNCADNGADYRTAWRTAMAPSRRGIFRHGLATDTVGGQTDRGFPFRGSIHNGSVLAHEAGHSMGLGHSGPMRITGDIDPNCKPNYPSIMNYAFDDGDFTFADGRGAGPLNNAALNEWQAVSPSNAAFLDVLEAKFEYWLDRTNGHVDWNRDGIFAPAGTTVRAYANNHKNGVCEYTRYNSSVLSGPRSRSTPSIARLGSRLYLFWVHDAMVRYAYSMSTWNCPVPSKSPCGSWSPARSAPFTAAGGLGVERLSDSAGQELLIVARLDAGRLAEARLSVTASGDERWTPVRSVPGAAPATGAPSLSQIGNPCSTNVAYRGSDGQVRFRLRDCGGEWGAEQRAITSDGTPITMPAYASPAIGRAFLPWRPGVRTYGAFADADGYLRLYGLYVGGEAAALDGGLDYVAKRWEPMTFMEPWPGRIEGRPAMAWVPAGPQAPYPGRFYLMAIRHEAPDARSVDVAISYTKVSETSPGITKEEKVGLNSLFDNTAYLAFGIDLLYEQGVDANLRSVTTVAIPKPKKLETVEFRPKADGINDFPYTNYDDWAYLRIGLCRQVIDPGGLGPKAVRCP
jgi:Right handed beta helix region